MRSASVCVLLGCRDEIHFAVHWVRSPSLGICLLLGGLSVHFSGPHNVTVDMVP